MCQGCSFGAAGAPWTPIDTKISQWNGDVDPVPDHCYPENSNWGAKYPFPRGPPVAYMEVPMDCCDGGGAKSGAELYIGGSGSGNLYFPTDGSLTSDEAVAFRSNGNNPCIKTNAPDAFGNWGIVAGCQVSCGTEAEAVAVAEAEAEAEAERLRG
jgi:hypothetical protein